MSQYAISNAPNLEAFDVESLLIRGSDNVPSQHAPQKRTALGEFVDKTSAIANRSKFTNINPLVKLFKDEVFEREQIKAQDDQNENRHNHAQTLLATLHMQEET